MTRPPQAPFALFAIDHLLSEEERAIRDVVREYVDSEIKPNVADWFESGQIPARRLAKELGTLGTLGMHLEGYGCQGMSAVAYGLACLELEAGDSGIRSLVSVQGSLAMYAIHAFGSEDHKQQWLPRLSRLLHQLWDATDAYRALYFQEQVNRDRVGGEHADMLLALRARDAEALVRQHDAHRDHSVGTVRAILERRPPPE